MSKYPGPYVFENQTKLFVHNHLPVGTDPKRVTATVAWMEEHEIHVAHFLSDGEAVDCANALEKNGCVVEFYPTTYPRDR